MISRSTVALKRLAAPALVLAALGLGLAGCSNNGSGAGKYVNEKKGQDYTELKSDGTCVIHQGNGSFAGKYAIDGSKLTLTMQTGDVVVGKLEGKTITDNEGEHWVKQ
jgi:hypothetical protein